MRNEESVKLNGEAAAPLESSVESGRSVKSMAEFLEMTIVVDKRKNEDDNCNHCGNENEEEYAVKELRVSAGWAVQVERVEEKLANWMSRNKRCVAGLLRFLLLVAFLTYFVYCLSYRFGDEGSIMLITVTCFLLLVILYRLYQARSKGSNRHGCCAKLRSKLACSTRTKLVLRYGLYCLTLVGVGVYLGLVVFTRSPENAQSLLGIFGIIFVCFVLSHKPSKVNWHPVFWGFVIQFCFAGITLQTETGYRSFKWLGDSIQHVLEFSYKGSAFVISKDFRSMGLAFSAGGIMIFFASLMGLFTHWGIIEFIVVKGGHVLSVAMETGPVESVIAIANIFIGLSQAPLLVRPYLPTMSRSELSALMTAGYASVSGDILALFIAFGAPPNHLLTAAVISAPAALAVAKILVPETQQVDLVTQSSIGDSTAAGERSQNALSAAADGALVAVRLFVSAMANMLAFVSLLALIDAILEWAGERAGVHGLTFDAICGYVLFPVAFAMGTPFQDCGRVGSLIGVKLFATPVIGYSELGKLINNRLTLENYNGTWHWEGPDVILDSSNTTLVHGYMAERSEVIATYAMCGFSAFTAIGISLGTLVPLCPTRKADIIRLVPAAFFGGNMASFATGAVAGLLHNSH